MLCYVNSVLIIVSCAHIGARYWNPCKRCQRVWFLSLNDSETLVSRSIWAVSVTRASFIAVFRLIPWFWWRKFVTSRIGFSFFFLRTRLINASYECNLSHQVQENWSETLVYDSVKFIAHLRSTIRVLFVQQNQPNQLRLFRYTQQVRFIAGW